MACGKYVIVSASNGLRNYFEEHNPGEVVPVGDPEAMASAIRRALDDPARCSRIGASNRERVVGTSSLDVYTSHIEQIIAEERAHLERELEAKGRA
jgi:glycosyltransferase involved in cell wall biosynthesis